MRWLSFSEVIFLIDIEGKTYTEKSTDDLPFGNACRYCAFNGTSCYDRGDFSCHSDSRDDGKDVVFILQR